MKHLEELARLLFGTVVYRPYVYAFFACFLVFALRQLRVRGTAGYLVLAWGIAFLCEYSSTRNGFPFGRYVYVDATRTRELWISNVPFWDSLSFVFLSYFSWRVAAAVRDPRAPTRRLLEPATAILAGLLMMLLDVVIDPVTLLGDRWFLGRIYYYPNGGAYFGVTLSNFAGWFFVGAVTVLAAQQLCRARLLPVHPERRRDAPESKGQHVLETWAVFGVYSGVFSFNLAVTAWIGEWTLFAVSAAVAAATCGGCALALRRASPALGAQRAPA